MEIYNINSYNRSGDLAACNTQTTAERAPGDARQQREQAGDGQAEAIAGAPLYSPKARFPKDSWD